MSELTGIGSFMVALVLTTALSAVIALFTAPRGAISLLLLSKERSAGLVDFWRAFQEEVMSELSRSAPLPDPPRREADPTSVIPPLYLYHGTRRSNMASVFARGIEGRSGGWAYAAQDYQTAEEYGRRWGGDYVVFRIWAQTAYQRGQSFQRRGDYWVTSNLHPLFIDWHWSLADWANRYRGIQ